MLSLSLKVSAILGQLVWIPMTYGSDMFAWSFLAHLYYGAVLFECLLLFDRYSLSK